jgi:OOP family OmpA-OmpF porin
MRRKMMSFLVAALLITATAAFGAVKEGGFSVTPLIGGYVFDDKQDLDTTLLFGIRGGYNVTKNFGLEALYDYATRTKGSSGPLTDISLHRFGGQALYHFFPDNIFVPYLAAGFSGITFNGDGVNSKVHGAFDYGAGAKYFITDDFALRGDVRHILYRYSSTSFSNVEFTLGAYIQFGAVAPVAKAIPPAPAPEPVKVAAAPVPVPPTDSDNDGVIDSRDKCPGTPSGVAVDAVGCPVDSDKDGVPDYLDKCADTPVGVAVDSNGCPIDSDKDGVADYLDKCPATPAGVAVDAKGCPFDSDNDGVADYLDKCPATPAGVAVDAVGCPLDSDKDGVPDYLDKCPDTPAGSLIDATGCVSVVKVEAAKRFCDKPAVIEVSFDAGKAEVKAKYHEELDKVGSFLKEFPTSKGAIEGHTDADGGKEINQKLSQARADSVRSYIVSKFGIEESRVTAKGYGSAKPVASNKNAAGKAKNRRIEAVFSCE